METHSQEVRAEYSRRRGRYREIMQSEGLDGLLVTHLPDIRYLCGFSGSAGVALLLRERGFFLSDFRYREQSAYEVTGLKKVIYDTGPDAAVAGILERYTGLRLGFDPAFISYAGVLALRRYTRGNASFVPLKSSLTLLRARKSGLELEIIRNNVRIAEKAFREALGEVGRNETEAGLAANLDMAAREGGAEAPSFDTIVASGVRGALVHARPSRARLRGATVVDWGIVRGGYCTDATRTVALGRVPAELKKAHRLVLEAQERAMEMIKPGVKAREIDLAAREVIEEAGLGNAFGHGLGHGVGLEVHESPYIGKNSRDIIEEGMVFTNEPGIYLPGTGGVRVEDMLLVTEHGPELLTTLPRSLDPADYA